MIGRMIRRVLVEPVRIAAFYVWLINLLLWASCIGFIFATLVSYVTLRADGSVDLNLAVRFYTLVYQTLSKTAAFYKYSPAIFWLTLTFAGIAGRALLQYVDRKLHFIDIGSYSQLWAVFTLSACVLGLVSLPNQYVYGSSALLTTNLFIIAGTLVYGISSLFTRIDEILIPEPPSEEIRPTRSLMKIAIIAVVATNIGLSLVIRGVPPVTSGQTIVNACKESLLSKGDGIKNMLANFMCASKIDKYLGLSMIPGEIASIPEGVCLPKLRIVTTKKREKRAEGLSVDIYINTEELHEDNYQLVSGAIVEYIKADKKRLQQPAEESIISALQTNFPCHKQDD